MESPKLVGIAIKKGTEPKPFWDENYILFDTDIVAVWFNGKTQGTMPIRGGQLFDGWKRQITNLQEGMEEYEKEFGGKNHELQTAPDSQINAEPQAAEGGSEQNLLGQQNNQQAEGGLDARS